MSLRFCFFLPVCLACLPAFAGNPLDFAKDVLPILERSCLPCHNATKSEADLMLETPQLMLKGGEKGPAIKPNHGAESLLYLTAAKLKKPFMPPAENKSKALPLSSQQVEIIRRWIDEGAIGKGKVKEPVKWQSMPRLARVNAVVLTNDGGFAAVARGNRVTLYDLSLKQPVAELPADAHRDLINALAFSPDGSLLATGSYGEVKLWKLSTLQLKPASAPSADLAKLECISPDGTLKASAPANAEARITSADGKKILASLRLDRDLADRIARQDLQVMTSTFELSYQTGEQKKAADSLTKFEEAAKKAATENADFVKRKVEIEKAVTEAAKQRDELRRALETSAAAVVSATGAKDKADKDQAAAQTASDGLKNSPDKNAVEEATKALPAVKKAAETAAKALAEATKKQTDATTKANEAQKALNEAQSETGKVTDAALTAKKTADDLAKGKADVETLKKLVVSAQSDLDKAKKAQDGLGKSLPVVPSPFRGLAFSADGKLVVSSHEDGCLRCWNARTGEARWTHHLDKQPLGGVILRDEALVVAKASGEAFTLDLTPRFDLVRTIGDSTKVDSPLTDRVNALAFSPDGKLLATGSGDPSRSGEIKLWDLSTGRLVREFVKPHKDAVLALDFSHDGRQLASGAADRAVRLWEVATGTQLRNLEAHSNHVLAVSLRHDGRMLASAGADGAVRTWSLLTGDVVKTISDFKKEVTSVHYAEQRDLLVATSGDPSLRLFTDEGTGVRSDDKTFKSFLTAGCATPDGKVEVAGDAAGTLWIMSGAGTVLASFEAPK